MFNKHDKKRNVYMLDGSFAKKGYDWWWHSFTGKNNRTGEEKHFFIEFFICNPALGGKDPVFGQLPENKEAGIRPSYLMVKAGCWGRDHCQLHRFFGIDRADIHKGAPFSVSADDCFCSEKKLRGSISLTPEEVLSHPEYMCDSGSIQWDLEMKKITAFNVGYGAGSFFRRLKAFEMFWHAEGMKTLYSGTVKFGDDEYTVTPEGSFGYADKNWGRDFTSPWIWLASSSMRSRITGKTLNNSVFDIGGGRPKIGALALENKLLGAFYYEGAELEYNFTKFWTMPKTKFRCRETEDEIIWQILQSNTKNAMLTEIRCRKEDMLLVNYEAPDGSKRHNRLWNGGNGKGRVRIFAHTDRGYKLIDDIDVTRIGCEYGEYDE